MFRGELLRNRIVGVIEGKSLNEEFQYDSGHTLDKAIEKFRLSELLEKSRKF